MNENNNNTAMVVIMEMLTVITTVIARHIKTWDFDNDDELNAFAEWQKEVLSLGNLMLNTFQDESNPDLFEEAEDKIMAELTKYLPPHKA